LTAEYQPRYVQLDGGWKTLLLCEEEWLARPDIWAFSLLPEAIQPRKMWAYYSLLLPWLLGRLACPCAREVAALVSLGSEDWLTRTLSEDELRRLQPPPGAVHQALGRCRAACQRPACAVREFLRRWSMWVRGMLAHGEWLNAWHSLPSSLSGEGRPSLRLELQTFARALLRDIVGNPYRPPADFQPRWRTTAALALARTVRESRRFEHLPILADALEEAGCDSASLLGHLRGPGPHFPGCHAMEAVLGQG
jgi:hypothetical protein